MYPNPGHPTFISMINYKKGQAIPYSPFALENEDRQTIINKITEQIKESKPNLIIINSPHNPSGYVLGEDEVKQICSVINQYNQDKDISEKIKVVSDEVYDSLVMKGSFYSPATYLDQNTPWAVVWSASKTYSLGGSRIGYIVSNRMKLIDSCEKIANNIWSCPPVEGQIGLIAALLPQNKEEIELYSKQMNEYYKQNVDALVEGIKKIIERKSGIYSFVNPAGAFYLFVRIDDEIFKKGKVKNSYELYDYLLKNNFISTLYGASFGNQGDKFLRISASLPKEDIPEGLKRLEEGLKSLM